MKKTTNKLWITSCLAMTVGLSFVNGEMIQIESGITIDTDTKIMWQDNSDVKTVEKTMDYCENLKLAGANDLTLPNKEIKKLSDIKKEYFYHLIKAEVLKEKIS